jgi:hypothetical protein
MELICDIFTEPNAIKTCTPFADLRQTMDTLIRTRDYHSQCALEFHLIQETIKLTKENFVTAPLIQEMFNCAVLNQRTSEYAIICSQFDAGLIGIKMDSTENLYQLYFILHSTALFISKIDPLDTIVPMTLTRSSPKHKLALGSQSLIENIFSMLTAIAMVQITDKEQFIQRLCLCNQNLNRMFVILK